MKEKSLLLAKLLCCSVAIFIASGCASAPQPVQHMPPTPAKVVLAPGNQIEIKFAYADQFNELQTIRSDGKIAMQFVGEVVAAGKTPAELGENLMQLYAEHLKHPELAVFVRVSTDNRIFVGGQVNAPGMLEMLGSLTALEAIMQAGGFNAVTATKNVVVVRQHDGQNQAIALNLDSSLDTGESAAAFYLQPRDIIYVPQKTIVKFNQWVSQYINDIVPDVGFNIQRRSPSGRTTWGYDTDN